MSQKFCAKHLNVRDCGFAHPFITNDGKCGFCELVSLREALSSKSTQISELKRNLEDYNKLSTNVLMWQKECEGLKAEVERLNGKLFHFERMYGSCVSAEKGDLQFQEIKELKECLGKCVEALSKHQLCSRCGNCHICGNQIHEALTTAKELYAKMS